MFSKGELYSRREDIHDILGGQHRSGIVTPAAHPVVLLFSGDLGLDYGYKHGWRTDGSFIFTGQGLHGDMEFERGNKAVRHHHQDGKRLFVFETQGDGDVLCLGEFEYESHHLELRPDARGFDRWAIVFVLRPLDETPVST